MNDFTQSIRFDLRTIAQLIPDKSTVLDLGCGNGDLLAWLEINKKVRGVGVECNPQKAAHCIERGLSVLQGDLNNEVDDYPDDSFDYVILSQTLQQVYEPARLLHSLSRIGRRVVVSFPNFSHYSIRFQLLMKGIAPRSKELPYHWYDTPNIRVITLCDFRQFTKDVGYKIIKEIAIQTSSTNTQGKIISCGKPFRATYGIYIIEKPKH